MSAFPKLSGLTQASGFLYAVPMWGISVEEAWPWVRGGGVICSNWVLITGLSKANTKKPNESYGGSRSSDACCSFGVYMFPVSSPLSGCCASGCSTASPHCGIILLMLVKLCNMFICCNLMTSLLPKHADCCSGIWQPAMLLMNRAVKESAGDSLVEAHGLQIAVTAFRHPMMGFAGFCAVACRCNAACDTRTLLSSGSASGGSLFIWLTAQGLAHVISSQACSELVLDNMSKLLACQAPELDRTACAL